MSKKGKHSKEEKSKLKVDNKVLKIGLSICAIIAIGIVIYSYIMRSKEKVNEQPEGQKEDESLEAASIEEPIVEETVDSNIENLINEIMTENNLNESNFFFFFYNIEEKKYYFYNENTYFTAASTIKVPVAMLYYDKITDGELNLSDTLLYNSGDYEVGDGSTAADYSVGERIPISYLLKQTIVNSDNTALNILVNSIGYQKCKEELTKYSDIELIEDFYSSNVANVSYYYDVLQYLYQNADKYSELIEYMKISSGGEYLKANIPQYEVAHKYGSYDGYVHDYGIIYGQNTYLIGVFTKGIANASDLIADIGEQVVTCVEAEELEETNEVDYYIDTTESNMTNTLEIQENDNVNITEEVE